MQKRQSKQNALAPPLGTSLRLGVPERRLESVGHEFKPAFGQRGLTGRLRSRSQADQEARARAARFASWVTVATELCRYLWLSGKPPLTFDRCHNKQLSQLWEPGLPAMSIGIYTTLWAVAADGNHDAKRVALDLDLLLISGAPLNHAGRTQARCRVVGQERFAYFRAFRK